MGRCKEWNVVVTGASSGIGRAASIAFGNEGATIWMGGRNMHELETTAKYVMTGGGTAHPLALDVTDPASIRAFGEAIAGGAPCVDVLINNAGVGAWGEIDDLDEATWRRVIDTNLTGPFLVTKALLPAMRLDNSRRRHIINIASVAGKNAYAGGGAYSASKFGLRGWTEVLALELAEEGIRVTAVNPGFVATPLVKGAGSTKDMIKPEDVAGYLVDLTHLPDSMFIDDVTLWPWKMYTD